MATVTVNGVELFYETAGAGECLVLTHGSWTDGSGWAPAVAPLAERYRVVTWDRRGHSRSQAGPGPGSRAEDAADLVGLIEHVSDEPVHLAGNSYGGNVTLTVVMARPELVASAAVHEPPVWSLLATCPDPAVVQALSGAAADLAIVRDLIAAGHHRRAAAHFIDHVALGPGTWERLPLPFREVLEANAPTFADELADPTALSVDIAPLATTAVPLLLTRGTESPALYAAVIAEIVRLVPRAAVAAIDGAGHIPHATHPDAWAACLVDFHERRPCGREAAGH